MLQSGCKQNLVWLQNYSFFEHEYNDNKYNPITLYAEHVNLHVSVRKQIIKYARESQHDVLYK
jgi:hypothetical protein